MQIKTHGPVNVIIHFPADEQGKIELAKRVAEIHSDAVITKLNQLNCPSGQKLALLDALIKSAKAG